MDSGNRLCKIIKEIDLFGKEAINEIQFNAFKKEDLMKFKDFMIVTEEELSAKEDFEKIKEILIKKYKDKNGNIK